MNSRDWLIGYGIDPTPEMITALKKALAEQREACAYAVQNAIDTKQVWEEDRTLAINACLNATGESDE